MADGKKVENRGGKRPGSGRPSKTPKEFSDWVKKELREGLRVAEREAGMSFGEYVSRKAMGLTGDKPNIVLDSQKLILEVLAVKESKQSVEVTKHQVPQVYLPETMPMPVEAQEKERDSISRMH